MALGTPYMTLLTIFASDVLHVGGSGLGLLSACSGVGALVGALFLASRDYRARRSRLMVGGLVGFGLALFAFAWSHWFWVSALLLIAVGGSQQMYATLNKTFIQEEVDEEYRGRVLSVVFLDRSVVPLGTLLAGLGTAAFGVQPTLATMATLLIVLALAASRLLPRRQAVVG
jgi:predicted MFS family arabinose efflux permease